MLNIKISLYQTLPHHIKDQNISDLSDVLYLTSRKFDVTYNRIVLPEILGN